MPITFSCACGRQLQMDDEYAGKRARCPECAGVVVVPAPVPEPPPLPARTLRADDVAAEASSLNPRESRPHRPRYEYDDEDEDDDRDFRRRREPPRKLWNNRVTGGVTSMVIAVVWFVVGLAFNQVFYFPPILFVIGLIAVIRGVITGRDE
jgi:DNA-directed RNA polymerase subunit RPC12/RpoP